jgi:hypothetical protein
MPERPNEPIDPDEVLRAAYWLTAEGMHDEDVRYTVVAVMQRRGAASVSELARDFPEDVLMLAIGGQDMIEQISVEDTKRMQLDENTRLVVEEE